MDHQVLKWMIRRACQLLHLLWCSRKGRRMQRQEKLLSSQVHLRLSWTVMSAKFKLTVAAALAPLLTSAVLLSKDRKRESNLPFYLYRPTMYSCAQKNKLKLFPVRLIFWGSDMAFMVIFFLWLMVNTQLDILSKSVKTVCELLMCKWSRSVRGCRGIKNGEKHRSSNPWNFERLSKWYLLVPNFFPRKRPPPPKRKEKKSAKQG